MIRPILPAIAALAIAAPAASAYDDAEIFATSNTAVITDAGDPRLDAHLSGFARRVDDIIREGGARPRGSELRDGVFFDSGLAPPRSSARACSTSTARATTSCTTSPTRSAAASSRARCSRSRPPRAATLSSSTSRA